MRVRLHARSAVLVAEVVTVTVTVKPGSKKGPLVESADDGALTIYVPERAIEGKATEAAARLLAKHLGVPPSRVELVSGATSRVKRFRVG
jgi:uncharacterized protein YggU (UPF0235/DUF167 family)